MSQHVRITHARRLLRAGVVRQVREEAWVLVQAELLNDLDR